MTLLLKKQFEKSHCTSSSSTKVAQGQSPSHTLTGRLNGLTILRYTLDTEHGGGMEVHVDTINRALLESNRMTIIQLYLAYNRLSQYETTEKLGRGTLIRVPMAFEKQGTGQLPQTRVKQALSSLKVLIRDIITDIVYYPLFPTFLRKLIIRKKYSRLKREDALNAGEKAREIFSSHNVDLVVINFAGGLGSAQVIDEAQQRKIPYIIRNSFSNTRLKRVGLREQLAGSAGVGGVSSKNIPKYIKRGYTNLSIGIKIGFFRKDNARPLSCELDLPLIILTGRIVPAKGHKDLLRAGYLLKRRGISLKIVFAGRQDVPEFMAELERLINHYKISHDVIFAGLLTQEEVRDWYAVSMVAVLPSYGEGLPRVLIEAQAMEVPVVAYDVDSVSEAMINGKSGYLVKKGDINGLALRIEELILDNNKRVTMGKAGREFVEEQFSFSAFIQRHEDWYLRGMGKLDGQFFKK